MLGGVAVTVKLQATNWVTVDTDDEDEALTLAIEKVREDPQEFFHGAEWDDLEIER